MLVNLVAERLDVLTDRINRTTGHAHQTCLIGRRSGHVCQPCYERKTGHAHQSCSKDWTCSPELLERRDMLTRVARKTGHAHQSCTKDGTCSPVLLERRDMLTRVARKTGHARQSCSKDGTCSPEMLERLDILTSFVVERPIMFVSLVEVEKLYGNTGQSSC